MKKYLMTGVAALAICAAFTSCSKSGDELYNPDAVSGMNKEKITETYNARFLAYVGGSIAPDQDWGFGTAGTRTARTESNLWYEAKPQGYGLEKPADLFAEEIEYVMNYFSSVKQGHGETLDLKNYFVQQVAYGNKDNQGVRRSASGQVFETIRDGQAVYRTENYDVQSKEHMDWIASNLKADVQSENDCDHVNNFNTGSGSLMYMEGSETKFGFAFKDSWGTVDKLVSKNYYMVHLVADYKGKHIDGWYVGFDYQTSKVEMGANGDPNMVQSSVKMDPDGIYNDRVVKIVPAGETTTPPTRNYFIRVLGEDLTFANSASNVNITESDEGADFDFNDVVFDVAHVSGGTTDENGTWIRLMAAGGTLPLYIGYEAEGHEVHTLFQVSQTTMVNTGHNAHKAKAPVEFKYSNSEVPAKDIPITVIKDGLTFQLSAERGEPASKIAVSDLNFDWADERQSIKERYPSFVRWAQEGQIVISEWWNNL